jgi:hypothetical protein
MAWDNDLNERLKAIEKRQSLAIELNSASNRAESESYFSSNEVSPRNHMMAGLLRWGRNHLGFLWPLTIRDNEDAIWKKSRIRL